MPSRIAGVLRRLYRFGPERRAARRHRDALEAELVQRLEPRPSEARVERVLRLPALAFASALAVAMVIGACRLPADYAMQMGHRIGIELDAEHAAALDHEAIARHVESTWAPSQIAMAVQLQRRADDDGDRGTLRIDLDVMGDDLDTEEIWDDLVDTFPVLVGARLHDEVLAETVHGTLGGKLSLAALDVVIDREGVDQARARIMAELRSQGVDPRDAQVRITDDVGPDGEHRREIDVRVQRSDP
jgi:hypothetical protein